MHLYNHHFLLASPTNPALTPYHTKPTSPTSPIYILPTMDTAEIYDQVTKHYSTAVKISTAQYSETVAKSFGYSEEELANIPDGANLGLSCGNPLAITSLREVYTLISEIPTTNARY